jgi:hypothetical protein
MMPSLSPLLSPRNCLFAGKYRWGQRSEPFGGSNGLVCLCLSACSPSKYCHNVGVVNLR